MKNSTLTFVTGNNGKFKEVERYINELAPTITLKQAAIDLPECQSLDIRTVALGKAQKAWELLQAPVLIDDGGIYLERYHQFPGTLSKYVYQGIGLDGIWLLAKEDPRAYFLSCLVYITSPTDYHFFEGICQGTIIKPVSAVLDSHLPYTYMFVPNGQTKTMAQLRNTEAEKEFHHRLKAAKQLVKHVSFQEKHR
ncbi:MAG: non-canonical purine NTP pyrophosphatase [Candidatus Amoebophilus sp.]